MYKQNKMTKTALRVNNSKEGETLEQKIERILNNKEPIGDAVGMIYQERHEGVNAAYDPRTDRFDLAIDLAERGVKQQLNKRQEALNKLKEEKESKKEDGKAESTQGQASEPAGSQTT